MALIFGLLGYAFGDGVGGSSSPGPSISLSGLSQVEGTPINTTIGTLSVINGSGTYVFTIIADPDSAFTLT